MRNRVRILIEADFENHYLRRQFIEEIERTAFKKGINNILVESQYASEPAQDLLDEMEKNSEQKRQWELRRREASSSPRPEMQ